MNRSLISIRLLDSNHENHEAHNLLASVYERMGENELAAEHYQIACQYCPDNIAYIHNKACNLRTLGK